MWLSLLTKCFTITANFFLYKPCGMCLILLHFQPCAGSEPDYNCCLSNKYTYMQLRSPEVTRVNFHLSGVKIKRSAQVQLPHEILKDTLAIVQGGISLSHKNHEAVHYLTRAGSVES